MTLCTLGVLTIGSLLVFISQARGGSDLGDLFFIPFMFLLLGGFWHFVLTLPQAIIHHPDDTLEFKAPLRGRTVAIGDLQSIEPVSGQYGMLQFRHPGGKVTVITQFDGFHELIATIKSKNPGIRLLGC